MNKIFIPIIVIAVLVLGIGAFLVLQKQDFSGSPTSYLSHYNAFWVHFEPRSAHEQGFQRFKDWVSFAKKYNQKFSLGFTPQWVEMIVNDPVKLNFVQELFNEGWDMTPQHHGTHHYWDWDGYCDFGAERCMKLREKYYRDNTDPVMQRWYKEKEQYNGDMNDYMELMNKLYPFKVMAMGGDKYFDWPSEILFSVDNGIVTFSSDIPIFDEPLVMKVEGTSGITSFVEKDFNGKTVYEAGMRFISDRNALKEAKKDYESLQKTGKENEFMVAALHIEDDETLFKDWIKYLHNQDPNGAYNKTLTEIVLVFSEPQNSSTTSNLKFQDSPFGMAGAYSRPFVTDDITPEELHKRSVKVKEPYNHVQDIGIKWVRPNSDIYWNSVQPTLESRKNGIFKWDTFDMLHGQVPSGVNILGTIDARPWGSDDSTFKPYTWEFADKEMERYYIKFVQEVVERYDGDGIKDMPNLKNPIRYWQVSNEPALRPLVERWEDVETVRENLKRNLDPQGFSHLVEITYNTIKEKNPEAKIVLAGMAGGHGFVSKDPLALREAGEFYFPILQYLNGKYIDVFDIHYYGQEYKGMKDVYDFARQALDQNGYRNTEIWFTETAVQSNKPFSERFQAMSLVKRYAYSLSYGAKKLFWWNMIEGEGPLLEDDQPSDHHGLIYDGVGENDPGYGVKKLSYYTYKKMTETLEGSDWNNIQTIQESDGVYAYKFQKGSQKVLVAWNDNSTKKQITISGIGSNSVKITEAVPKYESGKEVANYSTAFNIETKTVSGGKITITLRDKPVFVEE